MATSTYNPSLVTESGVDQKKTGFFARFAQSFVDCQVAKARRITAEHLTHYTDAQLVSFGWTARDIKRLRNID